MTDRRLQVHGARYRTGGRAVLDGVDVHIGSGEIVGAVPGATAQVLLDGPTAPG